MHIKLRAIDVFASTDGASHYTIYNRIYFGFLDFIQTGHGKIHFLAFNKKHLSTELLQRYMASAHAIHANAFLRCS